MGLNEITKLDLSFVWRRGSDAPKFKILLRNAFFFYKGVSLFTWVPSTCTLKVVICTCSGIYHRTINNAWAFGCKRIKLVQEETVVVTTNDQ